MYDDMYRVKYAYETYVYMHTSGTIHTSYSSTSSTYIMYRGIARAQATPRPGSAELDLTCGSHGSRKILPRSAARAPILNGAYLADASFVVLPWYVICPWHTFALRNRYATQLPHIYI